MNSLHTNTQIPSFGYMLKQNNVISDIIQFLVTHFLVANHELITEKLQKLLYFYQAMFLVKFHVTVKKMQGKGRHDCCATSSKLKLRAAVLATAQTIQSTALDSAFVLPLCRSISSVLRDDASFHTPYVMRGMSWCCSSFAVPVPVIGYSVSSRCLHYVIMSAAL
jgi:hypothetical protein